LIFKSILAAVSGLALGFGAAAAFATPMNGLSAAGAVSGTDTLPICRKATGCGTSDPLKASTTAQLGTYIAGQPYANAYCVAPGGSDSNAGMLAALFATHLWQLPQRRRGELCRLARHQQ
jgi:hypothetical protein